MCLLNRLCNPKPPHAKGNYYISLRSVQERGRCAVERTATGNCTSHHCCSSVAHSFEFADRPTGTTQQGRPSPRSMLNCFEQRCELFSLLSESSKCIKGRMVQQRGYGSIPLKHRNFGAFIGVLLSIAADTMNAEQLDNVLDLPRIPDDFIFEDDQFSVDYYQLSRDCPAGTRLTCQSEPCSVARSSVEEARTHPPRCGCR